MLIPFFDFSLDLMEVAYGTALFERYEITLFKVERSDVVLGVHLNNLVIDFLTVYVSLSLYTTMETNVCVVWTNLGSSSKGEIGSTWGNRSNVGNWDEFDGIRDCSQHGISSR
jgi:hypothetical protein